MTTECTDYEIWLTAECKRLKEAAEYGALMLALVTSSDGSGHADLARATLVKSGRTPEQAKVQVDEWVKERVWPFPPKP